MTATRPPAYRIEPLTTKTWDAIATLFREGGDPRWCWCNARADACPGGSVPAA